MHVVTAVVGLHQHRLAGEVGEDAQLDLGVVGAEQQPALLGQEGLADAAGELRAHRDVLQVGVAAAQPARGGDRLVEVGVDPAGFRLHQGGQSLDIGAAQFAEDAVLQHHRHHRVVRLEFLQHGRIGAPAGLGLAGFAAVELEGFEQQFAQLLGGGEVEVHPCTGAGLLLQAGEGGGQLAGEFGQVGDVDADAGGFHLGQHRLKGQLHLLQQGGQGRPHGGQLVAEQAGEPPGHMHVHAAVLRRRLQRYRGEAGPLRHQLGVGGGGEAKVAFSHHLQAVPLPRIAQVIGQQGVHHHPGQRQAVAHQDQPVVLGVLQGLGVGGAGQPGGQGGEHRFKRQLVQRCLGGAIVGQAGELALVVALVMADRDVGQIRRFRPPGQAHPHQLGPEGVEVGGFGVERHGPGGIAGRHQPLGQLRQLGRRGDQGRLQDRGGRRLGWFAAGWAIGVAEVRRAPGGCCCRGGGGGALGRWSWRFFRRGRIRRRRLG